MRILVADDHPLFRGAIRSILLAIDPAAEIRDASDYAEALARLGEERMDLVLLDLMMPGGGALSTLVDFINLAGDARVVVVSGLDDAAIRRQVRLCGVDGFIAKTDHPDRIARALRLVLAGGQVFPEVMDGPAAAVAAPCGPVLTAKQLQVLELLSQGQSNKGIANHLGLSPNTIKIHVTEILRKLGVSSRSQAVALVRNNWPAKGPTG